MTQRRHSYAELYQTLEDARTKEYRSDPERAEVLADTIERVLYLTLRNLAADELIVAGCNMLADGVSEDK